MPVQSGNYGGKMTVAQKIPVVLVEICVPVIADQAEQVDREGVFSDQAIAALRDAACWEQ